MKTRIKEGDRINVFWENVDMIAGATVLYVPMATGDSWHLREACGTLSYVQNFAKMELVEEPSRLPEKGDRDE